MIMQTNATKPATVMIKSNYTSSTYITVMYTWIFSMLAYTTVLQVFSTILLVVCDWNIIGICCNAFVPIENEAEDKDMTYNIVESDDWENRLDCIGVGVFEEYNVKECYEYWNNVGQVLKVLSDHFHD